MTNTFIAISGASGSGKTLFAKTIINELSENIAEGSVSILHEDAYYNDQSHLTMAAREQTNYDHPDAFDHKLMLEHLTLLRNGQAIESPVYDYAQHTRSKATVPVAPARVFLVEGILLLHHSPLCSFFDTKVFIDTPLDICLTRRMKRDIQERGRSLDSVIAQYEATVRPMFFEYVEPSKKWADVIVPHGGKNRMAIELLKSRIEALI